MERVAVSLTSYHTTTHSSRSIISINSKLNGSCIKRCTLVMAAFIWIFAGLSCATLSGIVFVLLRKKCKREPCQHVIPVPEDFDAEAEVVVVGAGVLGSSMAAVLARDGRKVTVVERELSEPDRIVGELLQPGGYKALKKLGLEDAVEGIDVHVVQGYVVHDIESDTSVPLSYPLDGCQRVQTGRSFHHGRFIMGLRREAEMEGANLLEGTVSHLLEDKNGSIVGVAYKDKKSGITKTVKANLTIVADGCFSRFRKGLVSAPVSVSSHFVGVVMHDCPQYKPGHAEIVLGNSGPILVYQISSEATRILVDIQGKMPHDVKEYMRTQIGPQLPEHIQGPFKSALEDGRIRSMPNSFLPPLPNPKAGVLLLGDAFNMRHPLTGAGMSVALNDTLIWRDMLREVPDLKDYRKVLQCLSSFQRQRRTSHSFVVNVLAQALYALFSASDEYLHDLRQACFAYFKLGGMAVSGPVGLLSILRPHPLILIGHFFAVAFYAVFRTLRSHPAWSVHRGVYRCTMIFTKACAVIFPLLGSELRTVFTL